MSNFGVFFVIAIWLWSGAASACRQALVLAIDVSASVSQREYELQRDGLAAALRDPQVADWIIGPDGNEIEILVFEWGDRTHQRIWVEWTGITDEHVLAVVAERIAAQTRDVKGQSTAIGAALAFASRKLAERSNCPTLTVDVSGDGKNNVGPRPRTIYPRLIDLGITVNGLVVATQDVAELSAYYHANVVVGPLSFVETAGGYEDYAKAIKRKLLRELVPGVAWLRQR